MGPRRAWSEKTEARREAGLTEKRAATRQVEDICKPYREHLRKPGGLVE
jgi:hypothetical protein